MTRFGIYTRSDLETAAKKINDMNTGTDRLAYEVKKTILSCLDALPSGTVSISAQVDENTEGGDAAHLSIDIRAEAPDRPAPILVPSIP